MRNNFKSTFLYQQGFVLKYSIFLSEMKQGQGIQLTATKKQTYKETNRKERKQLEKRERTRVKNHIFFT